jgi:hypothetical protein
MNNETCAICGKEIGYWVELGDGRKVCPKPCDVPTPTMNNQRPIKFRQRIDNQFHYWGFIDGKFISPVESSSGENPATTHHDEFTGLHDKNGKEIWEGDILGREKGHFGGHMAVVEFGDCEFRGRARDDEEHPTNVRYFLQVSSPYSVIGNIYENPDLLTNN